MKKSLLLAGMMLFLGTNVVLAKPGDKLTVDINNSKKIVREASISINGNNETVDNPSFVLVDRTFVPVRFVAEKFGYKVDWDQKTKGVNIHNDINNISFNIDSKQVTVNGEQKELHENAIPRLATFPNGTSSTMVPVRFISQTLGYAVGWDNKTSTVLISGEVSNSNSNDNSNTGDLLNKDESHTNVQDGINNLEFMKYVQSTGGKTYLAIKSSTKLNYTWSIEGSVAQISINNVNPEDFDSVQTVGSAGDIIEISSDKSVSNSKSVKLNIRFTDGSVPVVFDNEDGTRILIGSTNKISSIQSVRLLNQNAVQITGSKKISYKLMDFYSPTRVVIDILDASIDIVNGFKDLNISADSIKNVRVSQFVPDGNYGPNDRIVRVVLDMSDNVNSSGLKFSGEDILTVSPVKTIKNEININKISDDSRNIIFNPDGGSVAQNSYDKKTKTLSIFLNGNYQGITDSEFQPDDSLIRSISYSVNSGSSKVLIKFRKSIEYNLSENNGSIMVSVSKLKNINPSDITICIDAGHGGVDPGAVADDGYYEKTVNKIVSDRVQQMLTAAGYNVYRIRPNDESVDYKIRGKMANEQGCDIFVSIHANKAGDAPNAKGIEVLYAPEDEISIKFSEQKPLAQAILEETIKLTNAKNRGVVKRPGLAVLNTTTMPAALIELGFLSNSEELGLLKDPSYQELLAQGVFNGIVKYLNENF